MNAENNLDDQGVTGIHHSFIVGTTYLLYSARKKSLIYNVFKILYLNMGAEDQCATTVHKSMHNRYKMPLPCMNILFG